MHLQARGLVAVLPRLDWVVCSPLVRTTQTAEILVGAFDLGVPVVADPRVYSPASLSQLAARLAAPEGHLVAVVGHEPTVSSLIAHLTGRPPRGVSAGEAVLLGPVQEGYQVLGRWRGGERMDGGGAAY